MSMKCFRGLLSLVAWIANLLGALSAGLAACAAEPVPVRLPPDHPALPSAEEAPLPPPSTTLATTGPEAPASAGDGGSAVPTSEPGLPSGESAAAKGAYVCPMHADVLSNEPGKCPKCGMNLVKRPEHPHHDGGRR